MDNKEYYYMFSHGDYSDYCVGGLYKSKLNLTDSDFKEYKKQMIEELFEEGWDDDIKQEMMNAYSEWKLQVLYYSATLGSEEIAKLTNYHQARREFFKDFSGFTSVAPYLVSKGILQPLDYTEIHDVDG